MTRRRLVLLLLAVPLSLLAYVAVLGATAFVACGISGCSGGGYGPTYDPVGAQIGLLIAGLVLLPGALVVLRRQPRATVAAGTTATVVAGSVLAMALLGLAPDGCPQGTAFGTAGPGAFATGEPTCERR